MAATGDLGGILSTLKSHQAQIDTLTRRHLFPLSVTNNAGVRQVEVDLNGQLTMRTAAGQVVFQTDPSGVGLAYPRYPLTLVQLFTGSTGSAAGSCYFQGSMLNAPQEINSGQTDVVNSALWFQGALPSVSHPRLQLDSWTWTSGGGAPGPSSATWQLQIADGPAFGTVEATETWTSALSNGGTYETHIFDISALIGRTNLSIGIMPTAVSGPTGAFIFQPLGLTLRGTV